MNPSQPPRISVVMATYGRAEIIPETLRRLNAQTLADHEFEVIVIDDGSPDHTQRVLAEAEGWMRCRYRWMSHANAGPGYTQNRGIAEAAAPLVLLIADDILLAPQALAAHLAQHRAHPEPGAAVLGRVLQSPALTQSVFLRTWDPFRFDSFEGLQQLPYYLFWACNVSFKRDFMLQHGMFHARRGRAGAAAHEDAELGYRLHQHGLQLYLAMDGLGHHHHVETLDGAMKRAHQRGLNWGEFRERVPTPEIVVRYHVLGWDTLGDHWRALTGPGRRFLIGADRNPLLLVLRYLLRSLLFNRLTLPGLWLPLLRRAEQQPALARWVHRDLYRGVISWHFFKGVHDAVALYGQPGTEPGHAG